MAIAIDYELIEFWLPRYGIVWVYVWGGRYLKPGVKDHL